MSQKQQLVKQMENALHLNSYADLQQKLSYLIKQLDNKSSAGKTALAMQKTFTHQMNNNAVNNTRLQGYISTLYMEV